MPGRLEHRVAVITGGGSGIGMESSLLFASEGCLVIVADIDAQAAERTVEKIKASFADKCPPPVAVQCDVGKEEDVRALVQKAVLVGKRLDVIFNKYVHT
jgi:NAD(P)-dependent dehydrogenase (short-subunit alcohol dehydrogenase family)